LVRKVREVRGITQMYSMLIFNRIEAVCRAIERENIPQALNALNALIALLDPSLKRRVRRFKERADRELEERLSKLEGSDSFTLGGLTFSEDNLVARERAELEASQAYYDYVVKVLDYIISELHDAGLLVKFREYFRGGEGWEEVEGVEEEEEL